MTSCFVPPRRPRFAGAVWATLALAFLSTSPAGAQESGYLDHSALTDELRNLADASERVEMRSIATSIEGREVWLIEIRDPEGTPVEERPGVLVVGNLSGDHLAGSQIVLEVVRFLAADAAELDAPLSEHVFYLVPRLNPDGAEAMFSDVLSDDAGNRRPFDDDNDGRVDEDPGEDLNGDGLITVMRVPDPLGRFTPDPADPRLMVEADPARSRGGGYTLYWEGLDTDGDGYLNEDGPGGVDLDRNFQHAYPYYEAGAGPHMVSEAESRGLMDFVIGHRNIAAVLTFGHSDNLVSPPNAQGEPAPATPISLTSHADQSNADVFEVGVYSAASPTGALDLRGVQPGADNEPEAGRRPAVNIDEADLEYFEAISDSYREITGIERVSLNRTARGAFFQYGYFHYGVPSFSTQGWGLPAAAGNGDDAGEPGTATGAGDPTDDAAAGDDAAQASGAGEAASGPDAPEADLLAALESSGIDAFLPWTPFDHPELGEVEIGGFRPYAVTNPPPDRLPELGRLHADFILTLSEMLPRIRIASTDVEVHGGGLFTVTAQIENTGFLPSALSHGVVARSVDPVTVRIEIEPGALITGDPPAAQIPRLEGSGSREEFQWLIRGSEGDSVQIRVRSQKGGSDMVSVVLGENE